jgi:hypothetical protein
LHDDWVKAELKGNTESVVERQHDNEQFPLRFSRIILTDHKRLIFLKHLLEDLTKPLTEGHNGIGIVVHFDSFVAPHVNGLCHLLEVLPRFLVQFQFVVFITLIFTNLGFSILYDLSGRELNDF